MTGETISRRQGLAVLIALATRMFGPGARAIAMPAAFGRALEPLAPSSDGRGRFERRSYRADAAVLLLSVPVFRRSGVGQGLASFEEHYDAGGRCISLQFAGGSLPERAHGLNRFGWFREVVRERQAVPEEAHYFGVLTSSGEQSLDDGRAALHAKDSQLCTAIDGHNARDLTRSGTTKFAIPPGCTWSDANLLERARASFGSARWQQTAWAGAGTPWTFLYSLSRLLSAGAAHSECVYVYHERQFRLSIDAEPDPRQGRYFAARGLCVRPECVVKVRGKLTGGQPCGTTQFFLWTEKSGGPTLPLRIELQPRSFLRLAFEAQPESGPRVSANL